MQRTVRATSVQADKKVVIHRHAGGGVYARRCFFVFSALYHFSQSVELSGVHGDALGRVLAHGHLPSL